MTFNYVSQTMMAYIVGKIKDFITAKDYAVITDEEMDAVLGD